MKDQAYLAHLGELASLKNAIGSWFHMDAYLDFETDEEITPVSSQIAGLLERSDGEVLSTWNSEAFSHNFHDAADARAFLQSMLQYLRGEKSNVQHVIRLCHVRRRST
jgi:hypothetical protein